MSHSEFFTSYKSSSYDLFWKWNEDSTKIICIKNIFIKTYTWYKLVLRDVKHVFDILLSLTSFGILDDDCYSIQFGEGKWKLTSGSLVTARGMKKYTLYYLHKRLSREEVNVIENEYDIKL